MQQGLAEAVKAKAQELGFDLVGITGAEPSVFAEAYRDWMLHGYAGEMDYLTRDLHRRLDPRELLPDARSIIVVGMNYYADAEEGPGTLAAASPNLTIELKGAIPEDL